MYLEERVEQLEKQIEELKEQKKNELYLSPAQFAEKMSCSRSMVTKLVQNGEIEALRLGKLIRIPMSQFEEKEEIEELNFIENIETPTRKVITYVFNDTKIEHHIP